METTRSPPPKALKLPAPVVSHNGSSMASPRSELRPSSSASSPSKYHRSSFVESMRGTPHSPTQRTQPMPHQAIQDLINNPPVGPHNPEDAKFAGRDWSSITVGEIIVPEEVRFVQVDTSVEEATKLLITSGAPNVVLVRMQPEGRAAVGAFDYDDLIAYLLLVTQLALPVNADDNQIEDVLHRAKSHQPIPLNDIKYLLGRKEPPAFLDETATLSKAMEIFGSGFHRIIVRAEGSNDVVGILSQVRLVRFFWENVKSFREVDALHSRTIRDLGIGTHNVTSINGDKPLKEALLLMHTQGVSSLPIVDNNKNVIGNISHVDAKLLTTTAALPLLDSSCTHFITVILSERGMMDGKDSYPVFHVTPHSTLTHTVAKLVATRSHRMWVVDAPSPHSSIPPSPSLKPASHVTPPSLSLGAPHIGPPYTAATPNLSANASSLPGANISGHLTSVVSLTDVLNLFAKASGLSPLDPEETRRRRRTSSSSSVRSLSARASVEAALSGRRSGDLSRSTGDIRGARK